MRATVEAGLDRLETTVRPSPGDDWLLAPADHPTLDSGVVRALVEARLRNPAHSILIPTHAGRRGHPTLISWSHVPAIRSLPPDQGINSFIRGRADEVLEVPTASPAVLIDLDTPADYERLEQEWRRTR
jgi:CTP:molybdopterin cytidylyltransferase MocA